MDFQKITCELIATGLTQQQLADLVPCSQPTISAFLKGSRGARPSLKIGLRLLALHRERVEKAPIGRRKEDVTEPTAGVSEVGHD